VTTAATPVPLVPASVTQGGKTYILIPPEAGLTPAQIKYVSNANPTTSIVSFAAPPPANTSAVAPDGSVSHNTLGTILQFLKLGLTAGADIVVPLPFRAIAEAVLTNGIDAIMAKWGSGPVKERWLIADVAAEVASLPDPV
jgi:hypothetical protein